MTQFKAKLSNDKVHGEDEPLKEKTNLSASNRNSESATAIALLLTFHVM